MLGLNLPEIRKGLDFNLFLGPFRTEQFLFVLNMILDGFTTLVYVYPANFGF